ncbi:AAA family ATPase [Streptomyces sp. NPDC004009]
MSKRRAKARKTRGHPASSSGSASNRFVGAPPSSGEASGKLIDTAEALIAAETMEHGPAEAAPMDTEFTVEVSTERLKTAIQGLERAKDLAARRQRDHESAKQAIDRQREELRVKEAQQNAEFGTRIEELDDRVAKAKEEQDRLAEEAKRLSEWEARLFELEQAAQSDFAEYRHAQLQQLGEELSRRRASVEVEERQRAQEADLRIGDKEKELAERVAGLDAYEADLDRRRHDLERAQRRLTAREQDLVQEMADLQKAVEARFAGELETLRLDLEAANRRHDAASELARRRANELAKREAAELALGDLSLPEAAAELEELRRRNDELLAELAARPSATVERLADLEARCQELAIDREELLRKNEELQLHIAASRISVAEQQTAQLVNNALEQLNKTLRREIAEQSAELEKLQASNGNTSPFPACVEMDLDPNYSREPELRRGAPSLPTLVQRVRDIIARNERLYYSERDLRCFLGGLAASRLHLLQGISGIGKTRLPLAFARAIGAGYETVAVAAEWRSPQDLMGYYNAFERKFYETDFTKALYRAQLPLFRAKPFFVVLDEMNLSHPEQYFSDILHALELRESGPQRLRLMTSRVDPAPQLLRDGCDLLLPDNIWFVGTANHDETTVSFADKTYDRAHVLELPTKPEQFDPGDTQLIPPISLGALSAAFTDAKENHVDDVAQVLDFLDNELGQRLRQSFGISWGSRLKRQAESFIPVVRAAGGEIGEAADHLLATKVLRKLQGRAEVHSTDLQALRSEIQTLWPQLCDRTQPTDSLRALDDEIRYRGVL